MPLSITDASYAGTYASYFWLPATYRMDTVAKGAVYVKDGIKKSHTIGRIDFDRPLQARAATPGASVGTFTIDGKVLTPEDMMLYTEFNPRDFEVHWLAEQLSPQLLDRELPVTAENYMMQMALNRMFEVMETLIWMGSKAYTAATGTTGNGQLKFYDGFIRKFLLDAAVRKVASPYPLVATASVASTSTNIAEALDGLLNLAVTYRKALIARADRYTRMRFYCSVATELIFQQWLILTQFKGLDPRDAVANKYKGYEIVPLAGMPDNTILFADGNPDTNSNLYLGMNSTEDNDLMLMRLQNNSELFFLKGLMKQSVQYGFSEEIFLYTTLTAATFTA